jgi:hypothetical protein
MPGKAGRIDGRMDGMSSMGALQPQLTEDQVRLRARFNNSWAKVTSMLQGG